MVTRLYEMRFTCGAHEDMYPEVIEAMERMMRWSVAREAGKQFGAVVSHDDVHWERVEETVAPLDDDPDPFEPFKVTVYYAHVEVED